MSQKIRKKRTSWKALDKEVLVVAVERDTGEWTAYIGAVKGDSHEREYGGVMAHGASLPENVARLLFPSFRGLRYIQGFEV